MSWIERKSEDNVYEQGEYNRIGKTPFETGKQGKRKTEQYHFAKY